MEHIFSNTNALIKIYVSVIVLISKSQPTSSLSDLPVQADLYCYTYSVLSKPDVGHCCNWSVDVTVTYHYIYMTLVWTKYTGLEFH
jgi:hypothetical protein